jgi:hypothetical protein
VRLHRINENQAGEVAAVLGYLRELQRAYDLAVAVVHHARKHAGPTGGQSLRGSGDFFAWVDTALSLRRHRQHLVLSAEHRAAGPPDPLTLALVGTDGDMRLAILDGVGAEGASHSAAPVELDAAILDALDHTTGDGVSRSALRAALRVRNERLGDALTRLAAAGHIVRHGDAWVRPTVPAHTTGTPRNGYGNGATSE